MIKRNSIKPNPHGVDVVLDPEWLLRHVLYLPDGKTMHKSGMTVGQGIEAIALARVNVTAPQPHEKFRVAKVEFKEGKFHVHFAEDLDHLPD